MIRAVLPLKSIACLSIFSIIVCGCNDDSTRTADQRFDLPEPDIIERLKWQKTTNDSSAARKEYSVDLFAFSKNPEDSSATGEGPLDFYAGYQIFRDSSNNIVRIEEIPLSESGDWAMTIIHYFDKNGKTFAMEKRTGNILNACGTGNTYEVKTSFFDSQDKLIHKERTLTNGVTDTPVPDSCFYDNPYEGYTISSSSKGFMKKAGLLKAKPVR